MLLKGNLIYSAGTDPARSTFKTAIGLEGAEAAGSSRVQQRCSRKIKYSQET